MNSESVSTDAIKLRFLKAKLKKGGNLMSEKKCCHVQNAHHSEEFKKKIKSRLNRIEGQIRGIKRMVEEDTYCDDILNQVASVKSAMDGVAKELLGAHMKSCIVDQIKEGNDEVIDELFYTIKKLLK